MIAPPLTRYGIARTTVRIAWAPGMNADAALETPPALLTGASARPREDLPEIAVAHVGFHRAGGLALWFAFALLLVEWVSYHRRWTT